LKHHAVLVYENVLFAEGPPLRRWLYMPAIQNERIHSDLHKIGGWGSVLSSKHPCKPFKNKKIFEKILSPLNSFMVERKCNVVVLLPDCSTYDHRACA
jgi:hypothetical protein